MDYEAMAAGKVGLRQKVKGKVRPIHDRIIVTAMEFGEQVTAGGIIISSDDGKDRGIKPRWGQIVSKGNTNNEPYEIGDWVLVEHGRWTRGFEVDTEGNGEYKVMHTVEAQGVLGWQTETPENVTFGQFTGAGDNTSHRPEDFVNN